MSEVPLYRPKEGPFGYLRHNYFALLFGVRGPVHFYHVGYG